MTTSTRAEPRPVTPLAILVASLVRLEETAEGLDDCVHLLAEVRHARALAEGLDAYIARCTSPPSAALVALAQRTAQEDWTREDWRQGDGTRGAGAAPLEQEMLSGHVEGQLLRMLVRATHATTVLDLGMFTGYSSLAMAEALPDDGRVVSCEVDAAVAALAQECFAASPAGGRIDVRVGPGLQTLAALAEDGERFDMVFLDADKPGYVDYYAALLEHDLLAPDGLLCVDNTLMQGEPWTPGAASANGEAVAHFNRVVADDPRVEQVLLPLRDGVTLVRRVEP